MGCGASSHPADDAAAAEPDSAPKAAAAEPVTAAPAGENQLAIGQESNQDLSAPQNPQVSELFKQIDANGSGTISRSEVIVRRESVERSPACLAGDKDMSEG